MDFALDPQLEQSSFFIEDWPLCRIVLRNDSTWPWLYLVPRRNNVREIYELNDADQAQLVREISRAGKALNALYAPAKINTAALGNQVPQLHVHVFARFRDDPAWPRPVWAVQANEIPYTEAARKDALTALKRQFAAQEAEEP